MLRLLCLLAVREESKLLRGVSFLSLRLSRYCMPLLTASILTTAILTPSPWRLYPECGLVGPIYKAKISTMHERVLFASPSDWQSAATMSNF
jgi:hypothetical protein